jgi:hypothetical protein
MEKDKVLGVITVPVTVENVAENKKPELPDEVWDELKEIIKSELTQKDNLLGYISIKDGGILKRKATAVQQCIEHIFDCNPVAAKMLTNSIIQCGKDGRIYDNDLPEWFRDDKKWKRLDNMFLDLFQKHIIDVIRF